MMFDISFKNILDEKLTAMNINPSISRAFNPFLLFLSGWKECISQLSKR